MKVRAPAVAVLLAAALMASCSSSDGRELADPDPDLTATSAPRAAVDAAAPGSQSSTVPPTSAGVGGLTVDSAAFEPGGPIPARFTCMGGDRSPPLTWSSVPDGTVELAVVMRNATANNAVHWLVAGIDPALPGLAEGDQPAAVVPWSGPCPTSGTRQQYVFSLYALPAPLETPEGAASAEVVAQIETAAAAPATVSGTVSR